MNPSSNGWVKKLLKEVSNQDTFLKLSLNDFYKEIKSTGFIYGSNISVIHDCIDQQELTHEELCKVNLLLAFYYIHDKYDQNESFIESIISFYNAIENYKTSFFEGFLGQKKSSYLLEDMINKRVHIDDNVITKNFNYFITNAFLFIDVLAYQKYLKSKSISENYLKKLEVTIETIVVTVFNFKKEKSKYDESLTKLFEASLRYQNQTKLTYTEVIKYLDSNLSKYYITDIVCMAFWTDKIIDLEEQKFLNQLGLDLSLKQKIVLQSVEDINRFYIENKSKIALLSSKNMVQSFYDNSSKMVTKLISRNSKRLQKELKESKELMILLSKSTTRTLTEDEQKKVQEQLLDIIKSIPSLAIFMLPGGAILLPIFIKFIPNLLPSAFDDNRIED